MTKSGGNDRFNIKLGVIGGLYIRETEIPPLFEKGSQTKSQANREMATPSDGDGQFWHFS